MLVQLRVRNLAIIESSDVQFGPGLNVLTGETGAGKSILLSALGLVLGGRSDRGLVRTGQKEAWAEAMFDNNQDTFSQLQEWGIDGDLNEPVVLRRVISDNGRSKAFINSTAVPASHLQKIAPNLIDFGKQHEQATLTNPENHVFLLDTYAQANKEQKKVREAYQELVSLMKKKEKLLQSQDDRVQRIEFLQFQKDQIREVDPQPGELELLNQDLKKLQNVEECMELSVDAEKLLYSGDQCVQDLLAEAVGAVESLSLLDENQKELLQQLEAALVTIEDASQSLKGYSNSLHRDPDLIKETEQRLDQIMSLQEKYGGDFDNMMTRLKDIEEELEILLHQEEYIAKLDGEIEAAKLHLLKRTKPLSKKRKKAAKEIAKRVELELKDLAMKDARFSVNLDSFTEGGVQCTEDGNEIRVTELGLEKVAFYLAANKGEDLQPMEKVASGGELSRILLALKRVLSDSSSVQTFVFDEIDSGIGGDAVGKVAKKLRQIATQIEDMSQIICITHTAQIAAEANKHFHVSKHTDDGRTRSSVVCLSHEERVEELARMLAGSQSFSHALALAKDMLHPPTSELQELQEVNAA